jgi:hypothetical protein
MGQRWLRRLLGSAVGVALLGAPLSAPGREPPGPPEAGVQVRLDPRRGEIVVEGLDPWALEAVQGDHAGPVRWSTWCAILVASADPDLAAADALPMSGSYQAEGDTIRFQSKYPLDQAAYEIVLDRALLRAPAALCRRGGETPGRAGQTIQEAAATGSSRGCGEPLRLRVTTGGAAFPPPSDLPRVTAIFPSGRVLPENLLRFYLHFSVPMSRGFAYRQIHLLDADGSPIADPFLELDEELWTADGRRLTLLFDPGRIKRGLRPRAEAGPILEAGRRYTLVIEPSWPDAWGRQLDREFRHSFQAGPADEQSPDPTRWAIEVPRAETREKLVVRFPEPLDHALALRLIGVTDVEGRLVAGQAILSDEETRWSFEPEVTWAAGDQQLVVGTDLEDLAGNSVGRPFEVDLLEPITGRIRPEQTLVRFRILDPEAKR